MKRQFERRGIYLFDSYEDSPGVPVHCQILAALYGEDQLLDEERRRLALETIGAGEWPPDANLLQLKQPPPELMQALLHGVAAGNTMAALTITLHVDDPRVRPALAEATRRVGIERLSAFADALGRVGGPSAEAVLLERFGELLGDLKTSSAASISNAKADVLVGVAAALLSLNPQQLSAARAIVQLLEHPREVTRQAAARAAVEVGRRDMLTDAMRELWAAVDKLADAEDAEIFLHVAPALRLDRIHVVLPRMGRLLHEGDYHIVNLAARALTRVPSPYTAEALAVLTRWISTERPLGLAMWVASLVAPFLSEQFIVELTCRGLASESPSLRKEALYLSQELRSEVARALLENALVDEPEVLLQKRLRDRITEMNELAD
jgi:hypothetical protein